MIREFLLGGGESAAAAEFGARVIDEPELAARLALAEESLIEDYLAGALDERERTLFFEHFMTSPARLALLEEIALVAGRARAGAPHADRAAAAAAPDDDAAGINSPPLLARLRAFAAASARPLAAAAAVLIVAALVWAVFFAGAGGPTALETEYAALNARDLAAAEETAGLSTESLFPETFRGGAAAAAAPLAARALTEKVLFRLALPAGTAAGARFDLELRRGGAVVFRQRGLRAYDNPNGRELKVLLPRAVLAPGAYRIALGGELAYDFAIE